jgi:hypothetical protein
MTKRLAPLQAMPAPAPAKPVERKMPERQHSLHAGSAHAQNAAAPFAEDGFGNDFSLVAAMTVIDASAGDIPPALPRPEEPQKAALATVTSGTGPQPISFAALQAMPKARGFFVYGPPVGKPLSFIQSGGGTGSAAGYTDYPKGHLPPDVDYNATQTGSDWIAKPTLKTAAKRGKVGSYYTAAGTYDTGTTTAGDFKVYWKFSKAISDLVKKGEQEHCDDYDIAFKLSFQEAEDILNNHIVGKTFGPKPTKADAEAAVRAEIGGKLVHPTLGTDAQHWLIAFGTLANKTSTRDNSGWHSMSTGASYVDKSNNIVREVVAGSSQIGTHSSNSLITY